MGRRIVTVITAAVVVAGLGVGSGAAGSSGVSENGVSGPVVGGGAPQGSWTNLDAVGYREDEWFLDGVATAYAPVGPWSSDGIWPAAESTTAAFRTRMVVRRPTDPARFNGTVVVEWNNVSAGFDNGVMGVAARDELLRRGDAYVGVSAQRVGVEALRGDVARYGSLVHPGDSYSYDIFTQAARAFRGPQRRLLVPGLDVDRVLAAGESQSASRMVTYINAVQPLARAFNGFLLYSRTLGAASIADGVTMPAAPLIRADTKARVLDVQTEGDLVVLRSHLAHQDDTRRFRLWEVAGGAHADEHTLSPKNPPAVSIAGVPCQYRMNSARTHFVVAAAVSALDRWTRHIAVPTVAARIALVADATTAADPIARDGDGNAIGGIRLPQMQVPTATVDGLANPPAPGAPALFQTFCRLFGRTRVFDRATLDARYPSRFVYALTVYWYAVIDANLGFLSPEDPAQLLWEAATSDIGN